MAIKASFSEEVKDLQHSGPVARRNMGNVETRAIRSQNPMNSSFQEAGMIMKDKQVVSGRWLQEGFDSRLYELNELYEPNSGD